MSYAELEKFTERIIEGLKKQIGYSQQLTRENERLQDLILAHENDLVLLAVCGKLERAEAEIKESNDLLRSAFMIAKRDGKETNWEAWRKQLDIALARQHAMMYGNDKK